jgi:RNA polymerase sigma-70 factor (ECF subfamily)
VPQLHLPGQVERVADQLEFIRLIEPTARQLEDVEVNRLVARYQTGERAIIDELYRRYFDRVCGYARSVLKDDYEAEDIAQQVFIEVMDGLPRFEIRPSQPFRAWMFWLARNRVRDVMRKRARLEIEPPTAIQTRREMRPSIVEQCQADWIADGELAELVAGLPVGQRQVLVRRYLADESTEEISSALDRSPTAVRILQHRALRTLANQIGPRRQSSVREPMVVRIRPATVARGRRFALMGFGLAQTSRYASVHRTF